MTNVVILFATIGAVKMFDFMEKTDGFFKNQLIKNQLSIEEYAKKLCEKATITYEENDEVEGMVIGYTEDTPDNSSYITQVYVLPKYRKKGLGGRLLEEYIDYCEKKKLNSIWLTTDKTNNKAQKLYLSKGFLMVNYNHDTLIKMELLLMDHSSN